MVMNSENERIWKEAAYLKVLSWQLPEVTRYLGRYSNQVPTEYEVRVEFDVEITEGDHFSVLCSVENVFLCLSAHIWNHEINFMWEYTTKDAG
jgi:hypothetical protein